MILAFAALALLFLVAGWFIYHLTIQQGRLQIRLDAMEQQLREQGLLREPGPSAQDGLPRGSPLIDFELPVIGGA